MLRRNALSPRVPASLVALTLLAGCQVVPQTGGASPAPEPTPAPTPAPAPPPAPSPVTPQPAPAQQSGESWEVAPVAPGTWRYERDAAGSVASFGQPGAPALTLRCNRSQRQVAIMLMRYRSSGGATIRTSAGTMEWSGAAQPATGALLITRPANDPGLDKIAYSRGRISIEPAGAPRFILPVVSEIGRVIEDCRS